MKTKDWIAFVVLSFAWGTSFFWIKIAVNEIGPFTLVAFRLVFGVLGLVAVVAVTRPKFPRQVKPWLILALLGLTNVAVPFTLISWGEQTIDSAVASILNSSVPLFTAVLAHFLIADDRLNLRKGAGLLVGFAGVLVLLWRDVGNVGAEGYLGQLAVLLAAVFYAGSAIIVRRSAMGISSTVQSFGQVLAADIFMWLAVPMVESPLVLPHLPITWVSLIWLGLIGSCLAYVMYFYLINSVGPTRATQVTYVFPVVGIIFGTLFLGERLDWHLAAGAALVIGSILVVNWQGKKKD